MDSNDNVELGKKGILELYKTLFKYQKKYPLLIFTILLGIAVSIAYEILISLVMKWLFNEVLYSANPQQFLQAISLIVGSFILLLMTSFFRTLASAKLGANVIAQIRMRMFNKIQRTELEGKDEHFESESLIRFTNDLTFVEAVSVSMMWALVNYIAMLVIGSIGLFYFDWRMTLVILVIMPITLLLPRFLSKLTTQSLIAKKKIEAEVVSAIQENLNLHDVIHLHSLLSFKRSRFKESVKALRAISNRYSVHVGLSGRSAFYGVNLVKLIVLCMGCYLVYIKYLTPGQLIGFIFLLGSVNSAVNAMTNLYPMLSRAALCLENIEHLIAEKNNYLAKERNSIDGFHDCIRFDRVYFTYKKDMVLNEISFTIKKGSRVALVGSSGSGKTSILRLILKQTKPADGAIYFDGVDYNNITTRSLRSQIGIVMQNPKLFEGTVYENIRMGNLYATKEDIITAAQKAGIHEEIMTWPLGYETQIGKRNAGLSGGQCQRVAIARALVSNFSILCLDEVTSGLDPHNADKIRTFVKNIHGDYTTILITHTLNEASDADHIFVLDKGSIVEQGTHQELLNKKGTYSRLWEKQHGVIIDPNTNTANIVPQWLKHIPLFESFEQSVLDDIAHLMIIERKEMGEIIYKQGESYDKFYIIVSGIVELTRISEDGHQDMLSHLEDGDFFGEIAVLFNVPRPATVTTLSVCILMSLDRHAFNGVLKNFNQAQLNYFYEKVRERGLSPMGVN